MSDTQWDDTKLPREHTRSISRRRVLGMGAAALASGILGRSSAQRDGRELLRLGVILPLPSGDIALLPRELGWAAESARMGALFALDLVGREAASADFELDVLVASAPSTDAARRAAERMVAAHDVFGLIGGLGEVQARTLSDVAAERDVLFGNIGATGDALRSQACSETTFHIEASDAMYLDAIARWHSEAPGGRWFVVHPGSASGRDLRDRARTALTTGPAAADVVLSAPVSESPNFGEAIASIQDADVDYVLLLLDWRGQLDFLGLYDALGVDATLVTLPDPVSQTRRFYDSWRDISPRHADTARIALWDASLTDHGAAELNERFFGTFGRAMDPAAWAAYEAAAVFTQARIGAGTRSGRALAEHLRGDLSDWHAHKGAGVGFRAWNHQLRQPLYAVDIDTDAERFLGLGSVVGTVPDGTGIDALDELGLSSTESACSLG